jgi:small conductance mechanosensitive channel
MSLLDFLNSSPFPGITWGMIIAIIVLVAVAVALERFVTIYLRRFAKRARIAPDVANGLILTFRILVLIGALVAMVGIVGVSTNLFLAFSAFGGAAIGLASTQTIGNFIAGLYLLATRPFKVGDYVRLGTVEGVVEEITINFTKVLTLNNNLVSISNLQVMSRDMTNCLYEREKLEPLYCCTFEISFDHSVSADRIAGIFDQVFEQYNPKLPKPLSYMLLRSGAFDRVYMVYLYVKKPEDVFIFRPQIAEEVFKHWDMERLKGAKG